MKFATDLKESAYGPAVAGYRKSVRNRKTEFRMKRTFCIIAAMVCCALFVTAREQLTNIPTIYIDTENHAPVNGKEDYVKGTVTVMSSDENECATALAMGIRGRGNSTWNMPKKPYRIKFDSKTNFLGLKAKAKSWVLLANYADKTLLRNAMAFEMSKFMGFEFTPSIKFVDVVLNDKYLGNYMVSDQVEVNKNRVPVEEQEPTDVTEPDITGGYLLEIDGFADGEPVWFKTPRDMKVTIKYPKDDEINQQQRQYISDFICDFEERLFSDNYTDPETGYRALVDEKSLIDWYIACELTGNSDSFWSTYVYKKRNDGHICFGPLWDFDIAFNNDNRLGNAVNLMMRDAAHEPKTWIHRMWQDDWFRTAVNRRWTELMKEGLREHLLDKADEYAQLIDASQKMNFNTWKILPNQVYLEVKLFPTYGEGVEYLKWYIDARCDVLTESFAETDPALKNVEFDVTHQYLIRHSSGLYLSESNGKCVLGHEDEASLIQFENVEAERYVYGMHSNSGSYLASDQGWMFEFHSDMSSPYSHFAVERSPEAGSVLIKNIGRDRYLGTDDNNRGGGIYTDKSGTDVKHYWRLETLPESGVGSIRDVSGRIVAEGGRISLKGAEAVDIKVFSISGELLVSGPGSVVMNPGAKGVFIVVATDAAGRRYHAKLVR